MLHTGWRTRTHWDVGRTYNEQLYALWAAYCIHHDLVVSSAVYEAIIGQLFFALSSEWLIHLCNGYRDRFEERMAQYL